MWYWIIAIVMFIALFPVSRAFLKTVWYFSDNEPLFDRIAVSIFSLLLSGGLGVLWFIPLVVLIITICVVSVIKLGKAVNKLNVTVNLPNPYNFLGFKWVEDKVRDFLEEV